MRHWNFMRLSQEGKILTDLYGLQLPTSLCAGFNEADPDAIIA